MVKVSNLRKVSKAVLTQGYGVFFPCSLPKQRAEVCMYYTAYQNNLFSIKITYSYLYYQRSPGSEVSAKTSLIDIKLVLESQYSLNLQHGILANLPRCLGIQPWTLVSTA